MGYYWIGFAVQLIIVRTALTVYFVWSVRLHVREVSGTWILHCIL